MTSKSQETNQVVPQAVAVNFETNPFKILSNGISKAFKINQLTVIYSIVASFVLGVTSLASGPISAMTESSPTGDLNITWISVTVIFNLIYYALAMGLTFYAINVAVASLKGEAITPQVALSRTVSNYLPLLGISFVLGLMVAAGFIVGLFTLFIPFILVVSWYSLTLYAYAFESLSMSASMARSKKLIGNRIIEYFALSMISGFLAGIIGPIVTSTTMAEYFVQLREARDKNLALPKVSAISWAVVGVLIFMLVIFLLFIFLIFAYLATSSDSSSLNSFVQSLTGRA